MKCLVTGATGFIGEALCRELRARGDEVIQTSLHGASLADGSATTPIDLAINDLAPGLLTGVDTVFHLAGIAHNRAAAERYEQVNFGATARLAAAASTAGVRRFIFLSSVKAMGPALTDEERTEGDVVAATDDYGRSKWDAECALRAMGDDAGMTIIILRPALVYDTDAKGNLALLSSVVRRGLPRPPQGGARSMIARGDLVSLLLALSGLEFQGAETWIATDGEQYTTRRIYDALCRAHGVEPGRDWLPRWCWLAGARLRDLVRASPGSTTADKLFGSERYSNAALLAATGWRPRLTLEDVLVADSPPAGDRAL